MGTTTLLTAGIVTGLGVAGMHCTGMSAMTVHLHGEGGGSGTPMLSVMLPMLLGPLVFLLFATAVVMLDPLLISGDDGRAARPSAPRTTGRAGATGQAGVTGQTGAGAFAGFRAADQAPAPNAPVPSAAYPGEFGPAPADPWARGTGGDVPQGAPGGGDRGGDRPSGR